MTKHDWTSFRKRIAIRKPANTIYNSWAKASGLTQWFLEKAEFSRDGKPLPQDAPVQTGDSFVWKWNNWDVTENGKVLEANGRDRLCFTFGPGGEVEVSLEEKDGSTEVALVQRKIPTDDKSKMDLYVGCSTGWTFWMANLKAWLEHGITLHATGLKQDETRDLVNS